MFKYLKFPLGLGLTFAVNAYYISRCFSLRRFYEKIILTGGGTAGHVTPNLAPLPSLKKAGYEIRYIGSYQGIERKLIEGAGIPYDGISSGKLRRYFDLKNFSDPFRVAKGYFEALRLMKRYKPDVVFSKGWFCLLYQSFWLQNIIRFPLLSMNPI